MSSATLPSSPGAATASSSEAVPNSQRTHSQAHPHEEPLTWGKTPTGKVFRVPVTHDMLHNLFANWPPTTATHTWLELTTLGILGSHILLFVWVSLDGGCLGGGSVWRLYFAVTFLLWRAAYNAGLGWILKHQSESHWFSQRCKDSGYFERESAEKTPQGKRWYNFFRQECEKKMLQDYSFEGVPVEFNAWLVYRNLVDLILVNDFVAYLVFALAFTNLPSWSGLGLVDLLRYVGGFTLIAFNWWVKRDAHRVVKDFAWYWGDFFFLVDKDLTFDGVFEMAPHPMYSVGYAGYYGVSLISNSFVVLCVSLLAHAAQFLFLYLVEEPHIQKTYGTAGSTPYLLTTDARVREILYGRDPHTAYFRRDLIVLNNFDLYRSSDLFLLWSMASLIIMALPLPGFAIPPSFFLALAVFWRCVHTFGLGWALHKQSKRKTWTRHFIQFGGTYRDAFYSWKSVYNFSMTMMYLTFILAAYKFYDMPESLMAIFSDSFLLRHILGALLILLQVWMSTSVYQVLGDFGWFYGDFFIDEFPSELHYTGIYRFLNNPEKILGLAAFWGLTLMSNSLSIFLMTVFAHFCNWWFLEYVEAPHMQKIYGSKIRKESGVTKTIKAQLAAPVRQKLEKQKVVSDVNKVIKEINKVGSEVVSQVEKIVMENIADKVKSEVERVIEVAKPKIDEMLAETRMMLTETTSRLSTLGSMNGSHDSELDNLDLDEFSVQLRSKATSPGGNGGCVTFTIGEPITVYWTAPKAHSPKDWIGIYKVTANPSPAATTTSARGSWAYIEGEDAQTGKVEFDCQDVPWEVGVYECRLHLNDKYLVLAKSVMFEIKVDPVPPLDDLLFTSPPPTSAFADSPVQTASPLLSPSNPNSLMSITAVLLPLYQRALNVPTLTPSTSLLQLTPLPTEKQVGRIVYGVKLLYGVDLHWRVIAEMEPTLDRIAERIQEARVILAPASSSWMLSPLAEKADAESVVSSSQDGAGTSAASSPDFAHRMTVNKYLRMIEKDRQHQQQQRGRTLSSTHGDSRSASADSRP